MLSIKTFVFNAFQENTYIAYDGSGECVIIDPGMSTTFEREQLSRFIDESHLLPIAMINTHCHVDHILGCPYIKEKYNLPFYTHPDEKMQLEHAVDFGIFFGIEVETPPPSDHYLDEGSVYRFGKTELSVAHVPGHSPGSITLYSESDKVIITGDVLFRGSIGRTDLPGGDYDTLINGIKSKLLTLPPDVLVYPGHGPSTTIGAEYDTNPFLK
jgi:glyoxylase-like metal-dependent hydrolase (beta-lactamase superfamily II)